MVLRTSCKFDLWHRKYVVESKSHTVIYLSIVRFELRPIANYIIFHCRVQSFVNRYVHMLF